MSDGPFNLFSLSARKLSNLSINAEPAADVSVGGIIWIACNHIMQNVHLGYDFNNSEFTNDDHLAYDEDQEHDTFSYSGK